MSAAAYDLTAALGDTANAVEEKIKSLLPNGETRERKLFEAMEYACLNGGKRLRPFLVMNSAGLFGVDEERALRAAAAIEMIHCYSLVHDDLPAMDDDDLRRGKPTTHKAYDEATAILVGDGLLTLAFEVAADPATHEDPSVRCRLVTALARASGAQGMVGGQMIDLMAEKTEAPLELEEITRLQQRKTGALIAFSCEAGAILGKASDGGHKHMLGYAHDLGLAFQIADDLLDHDGTEEETGKKVGKDANAGKATFVSLLGAEPARTKASQLADQAVQHLRSYGAEADGLRAVARFVVERRS